MTPDELKHLPSDKLRRVIVSRILHAYRVKVRRAVAKGSELPSSWHLLGAEFDELVAYIQKYLSIGMKWWNYGDWNLVNMKKARLLQSEEEFFAHFHFKNYRPRWVRPEKREILLKQQTARKCLTTT